MGAGEGKAVHVLVRRRAGWLAGWLGRTLVGGVVTRLILALDTEHEGDASLEHEDARM